MQLITTDLRLAILSGFILTAPFALLELALNGPSRKSVSDFPFALFAILWLLPMLFIFTLMPLVRTVQMGERLTATPIQLTTRVVILVVLAVLWIGIVNDQLPCFLGVPNCD